ncbi:hypothetical protein WICANDRAFT_32613 [Wickerhamomyces anomalus NRRL Y-366-8]|uniref:Telomere length regulation protein conserved domain-containing protein n=1 Tax=Wickerhamomyces anomalus (strain ATCC 58044 / CBS 1984 / NCYC 433 / NRRL Y-366-8) TaxID=683960 RepID=A0A1E3P0S1_WICAA|nr:uncharacterized protein WICANDRAFT_32613 [Wickerhamomyces anomalus NRRL Y-366-8]ODQ58804.1 hypothetical protein WICANDRAFT_32613 [Wickerhamomyces anomalus NRRL Y-366-8]
MNDDFSVLKSEPSAEEIDRIVTEFISKENALPTKLQFINTILQHILPIYQSLKTTIRLKIRRAFHSSIGISNLLKFYSLTKNEIYLKFMKDLLLDQTLLVSVIDAAKGNKTELGQVRSLFVGSKIFQTFEGKLEIERYLDLVTKQLIEACKDDKFEVSEFVNQLLSLHPIDAKFVFLNQFFNDNYFNYLVQLYSRMTQVQKKQFLWRSFFPYLDRYVHNNNIDTVTKILKHFVFTDFEDQVVKHIAESKNINLQQAISLLVKDHKTAFKNLLKIWGNEQFIKDHPSELQEANTKELLILINYMDTQTKGNFSKDRTFLDAITSRISSNDNFNRGLGMMVAKKITNGEINFDIVDEIIIEPVSRPNSSSKIDFTDLILGEPLQNLSLNTHKETKVMDSDDESDIEEDQENGNIDTLFLKDLIKKFNDDKISSITKLLAHTTKLVRQKATFKIEIEFYSEELISVLIGLINKFDESNFEDLKLNAIVSVIVVNPKIVSHTMNLLFTGDYSFQQRMIILSSISLAARELRGIDDDFIDKPTYDFPTRKIEQRHQPKIEEVQRAKIEEIKNDSDELIGEGTVKRISKKLTATKEAEKPNNFARLAPKFFYPLANGWIQGINVGTFNEMFMKHYLQTLELVVKAAYPCHEFDDMFALYNEILENSQSILI